MTAAISHQAKLDTGLGVVPGMNSAVAMQHLAAGSWATATPAQPAWSATGCKGAQASLGTSPALQGRTGCTSSTTFATIAREVPQPQHQDLASRFPVFKLP
jgi:hypothetical protein